MRKRTAIVLISFLTAALAACGDSSTPVSPVATAAEDSILTPGDPILALDLDSLGASSYPVFESPADGIDGIVTTKYLNFGKINSGFIVTPSLGPSIVESFRMITANDAIARDPETFQLYGTNDPITSVDNGQGMGENWTLIASGTIGLPAGRRVPGPVIQIANASLYRSYRFVVTGVKDAATANSMQFSEIQFQGRTALPKKP